MNKLLRKDFEDRSRYRGIGNGHHYLADFIQPCSQNSLPTQYLKFVYFLAERKYQPVSLLSPADELDADGALGILETYMFEEDARENSDTQPRPMYSL